jgi:hypothetical protein
MVRERIAIALVARAVVTQAVEVKDGMIPGNAAPVGGVIAGSQASP